jgi:CheY-like chemotaxis protein
LRGNFLRADIFSASDRTEFTAGEVSSATTLRKACDMKAILFVDDHEVLARLSCEILEMQGYRAVSAYSAEDALEKFESESFDLLVTDFRMEGMNGLELAKRIHQKNPEVPVIIVTGYGPVDGGQDVKACLQKEDLFPELLEKIKFYLADSNELVPAERAS